MEEIENFFSNSSNLTDWVVRVIVYGKSPEKTESKNLISVIKKGSLILLSKLMSDFGMAHVGIQFGPYVIDLVSTNVRIMPHKSKYSMLVLYPDRIDRCSVNLQKNRTSICNLINSYRKYDYNLFTRNCQDFVNDFLMCLQPHSIEPLWKENDNPIKPFLDEISDGKSKINNFKLNLFGVSATITCHQDLFEYWNKIENLFEECENVVMQFQVLEFIKGLQRGFQLRNEEIINEIKFDGLDKDRFTRIRFGNMTTHVSATISPIDGNDVCRMGIGTGNNVSITNSTNQYIIRF